MRLINYNQIEWVEFTGTLINRLNARDCDITVHVSTIQASRVETDMEIRSHLIELVCGLLQKFADMGED